MMRPARPGDRCFLVRDRDHGGRNIGKTCTVLAQCRCEAGDWEVETLEPWLLFEVVAIFEIERRCPAGTRTCVPKPDLRPIDDPDLKEPEDVSHPAPTDVRNPDPATTR